MENRGIGSEADRVLVAQLTGEARYHAKWRPLSEEEEAAALAGLRALAGGRADLLAEVAGIFEGTSEGELDEPLARCAARLCRQAGADPAAIPAWIEEGRRRSANARQPPFSGGARYLTGGTCFTTGRGGPHAPIPAALQRGALGRSRRQATWSGEDEEGFLFVVDRKKDMIISGGENIYCAEVENILSGHPAVADVAVIGARHDKWGETPVAVVVPADPAAPPTLEDLTGWTAGRLASYKKPAGLVVLDELPRNASGKVLKHELRARYSGA